MSCLGKVRRALMASSEPLTVLQIHQAAGVNKSQTYKILDDLLLTKEVIRGLNDAGVTTFKFTGSKPTRIEGMTMAEFNRVMGYLDLTFEQAFEFMGDSPQVQQTLSYVCAQLLKSMKHTLAVSKKQK